MVRCGLTSARWRMQNGRRVRICVSRKSRQREHGAVRPSLCNQTPCMVDRQKRLLVGLCTQLIPLYLATSQPPYRSLSCTNAGMDDLIECHRFLLAPIANWVGGGVRLIVGEIAYLAPWSAPLDCGRLERTAGEWLSPSWREQWGTQ